MENHHQQAGAGLTGPPAPTALESAASFLQEEEDEFERLFTELLYASHSRAAAKMADLGEEGVREPPPPPPPSQWPSLRRSRSSPAAGGGGGAVSSSPAPGTEQLSAYERSLAAQGVLFSGESEQDLEQDTYCVRAGGGGADVVGEEEQNGGEYEDDHPHLHYYCDGSLSDWDGRLSELLPDNLPVLRVEESDEEEEEEEEAQDGEGADTDSMERSSGPRRRNRLTPQQLAAFRKSHSFPVAADDERPAATRDRHSDGSLGSSGSVGRPATSGDTGDKLFFDLLDDLDNITGNTPSMKRRQRARDIFSDWLFSEQVKANNASNAEQEQKKKNRKSFHEFMSYRGEDEPHPGEGGATDDSDAPDRQNRAGSEPSEGRHGGGGNGHDDNYGNYDFRPLQRKSEQLSMSEHDALMERRIKEEYLAGQSPGTGSGPRSPSIRRKSAVLTPDASSPVRSPSSPLAAQLLASPLSLSQPSAAEKSQRASATMANSNKAQPSPKTPTTPSPSPGSPATRRRSAGFSANNAADTLEILKHVKFRKKSPKCQVFSEAEAKAEQQLSQRMSALGVGPRNIYQRWKLRGRPLSFEYLSEKIYSGNTVVYSKRRSLQEDRQSAEHSPPTEPPEDLFAKRKDPDEAPRPPLVPETAWSTLRQVAPLQPEAETSFNERRSDEYGSIRFDTVKPFVLEDDADSGYHTGESTLCGGGGAPTTAPPPPGERTLSREDLKRRIEAFNDNQHGLLMTLRESSDTFQGFIRVYMNLMRPISMSLTARPPSIYDILTPDVSDPQEYESDTQLTSFYLPKDTTKVIHITSDTTAQEVIRALLQKFRITDNPRKFALYERLDEGSSKSTMRRLRDDECPLPLCLCWTAEGLNFHRFILQENDTGEIIWEAFSIPELENFLRILDREEEEYAEQVKAKYHLMKIQMVQHMKHLDQQRLPNKDQRTPVFV